MVKVQSNKGAPGGKIVPAQCAGQWYPGSKGELTRTVDDYLRNAKVEKVQGRLVALIAPHAGYFYSGAMAGYSYRQLEGLHYDTVVVVGFNHGYPYSGISVYTEGYLETPLGLIEIDSEVAKALTEQDNSIYFLEDAFLTAEHSIENQLPFLQRALDKFKVVPVMFGTQSKDNVDKLASALAAVLKGKNVLMVASSDMSHFWGYDDAVRLDEEILKYVRQFDPEGIQKALARDDTGRRLCGRGTVVAVMKAAKMLGADKAVVVKYNNSGDVSGDRSRVVGYMASAFYNTKAKNEGSGKKSELNKGELNETQQKSLLKIARESLEAYIRHGERKTFAADDPALKRKHGMFVTLTINGQLRGCMGHFEQDTPLNELAAKQVIVSATGDPRFLQVRADELNKIKIEISVLSPPEPVASYEDIIVGVHGVILEKGYHGATFLPQVAPEQGWDRDEMLTHLAMKAGLSPDGWKEGATFKVYTAQVFGEEE
ncbi:MAG: AmmeMemoRadiSam system protein B [bacterium]